MDFQGPKGLAGRNGTDGGIGDEGKMGEKVSSTRKLGNGVKNNA